MCCYGTECLSLSPSPPSLFLFFSFAFFFFFLFLNRVRVNRSYLVTYSLETALKIDNGGSLVPIFKEMC